MPGMVEIDAGSKDKAENDILLGVLDLVERDPAVTQRSVAKELGIALGLANAYLKRCIQKGLVKVSQVPRRRYAYYLTPQGFTEKSRLTASYLAYSFSFFRQARMQMAEIFSAATKRGQRRLVLIGDGDLAEIAGLVAGKHPVEIVATFAALRDTTELAASLDGFGNIDGIVITETQAPRDVLEAALARFGAERVWVPALLGVRMPSPTEQRA